MLAITGGKFKGRALVSPRGEKTRPTLAKIRQALFNSLQFETPGARVADLFAGTGALGIEALSRGAEWVCFVDGDRDAQWAIQSSIKNLQIPAQQFFLSKEKIEGTASSVEKILARFAPFDLIFIDPPYEIDTGLLLLSHLDRFLSESGIVVLEWDPKKGPFSSVPDLVGKLEKIREKTYGDTWLTHYKKLNTESV